MCFSESVLEAIDYTRAKQWPGIAEDKRRRDQDGMEKPAAQDKSGAGIEAVAMIYISSK